MCIYALPLALCLVFLFPLPGEAHAVLLSSDPAQDAVVSSAPSRVHMRFSEDLSPALSTAAVVNAANHRVDQNDAHISPDNSREMDISLKPDLPSDVYVVVWQTQSADDGHVLRGSFLFKVAAANGSVPSLSGAYPGLNALGRGNVDTGLYTGQMDGPVFFNLIMITLVDLSAIFWVGAQLWHTFVLQFSSTDSAEQHALDQSVRQRFETLFSLPTLLAAFIVNLGVLIGQGFLATGGSFGQAISLFGKLASNGRFGTFWTMREIVLLLALVLAGSTFWPRKRSPILDELLSWTNLALGLAFLIALTLSGHAAAVNNTILVYAALGDWLHLLAASLWIGGMVYLSAVYLPVLKGKSLVECTRALLTTLPRFSPLAIAGVVMMALSGPFNATVHMDALSQFVTTAYGRALLVKVVCVGALLVVSAIHVRFLRPHLSKTFDTYQSALTKVALDAEGTEGAKDIEDPQAPANTEEAKKADHSTSQEVKELERSVARQMRRLTRVLRWEPVLGIAVLICTGLMAVFAGTLQPITAPRNQLQTTQQPSPQGKPFSTTVTTTDGTFSLQLTIAPNRFGPNVFTVHVADPNGKQETNVGVSLYLTMLDMDMGTEPVNLQPDGKGGFSSQGDLAMYGNWQVRLEVRTLDNTLHEVTTKLFTPV